MTGHGPEVSLPTSGPSFPESGWDRPKPLTQHTLFGDNTERSLAAAGVSPDEANEWFARGWLSYMPAFLDSVDEPAWQEPLFVRDLARSTLPLESVGAMLKLPPRPYLYNAARVAFSVRFGWVELPSRRTAANDPASWTVSLVRKWVELPARRGEVQELRQMLECVYKALDNADPAP